MLASSREYTVQRDQDFGNDLNPLYIGFSYLRNRCDTAEYSDIYRILCCSRTAQVVKILVALNVLCSFGLCFCVPSEILWRKLEARVKEENQTKAYYTMRVLLIFGCGMLHRVLFYCGVFFEKKNEPQPSHKLF